MKKKLLCLFFALLMTVTLLPFGTAAAADARGLPPVKPLHTDPAAVCTGAALRAPNRGAAEDTIRIYDAGADATVCIGETFPIRFLLTSYANAKPSRFKIALYSPKGAKLDEVSQSFSADDGTEDYIYSWSTAGRAAGTYSVVFYPEYQDGDSWCVNKAQKFTAYLYLAPASGSCGPKLDWTYAPATDTLTITGSGAMTNFSAAKGSIPTYSLYYARCRRLVLPDGITSIGKEAFWGFSGLTELALPDSVTVIGADAFCNCDGLTEVTVGQNISCVAEGAFCFCDSLKKITILNRNCKIRSYEDPAHDGCTLGVPGVTAVCVCRYSTAEDYAAKGGFDVSYATETGKCGNNLTWQYEPYENRLSIIGFGDMYDYNNYNNFAPWKVYANDCTEISLDYKMTRISVCAFLGFNKVPSITIPKNCTYIDDFAFLGCSDMVKASFVTATHIGHNALANCTSLKDTYVFIPDCEIVDTAKTGKTLGVPGYTTIHGYTGSTAFDYAARYGYTFVDMDTGCICGRAGEELIWSYDPANKTLDIVGSGAMYDYNNYNNPAPWKVYANKCTAVNLDYRMTRVSVCAFLGFDQVDSITIPKNCTYIDDFAFLNCSSMVKASFVTATHIGHNALAGCSKLKDTFVCIPNCEIVDTAKTGRTLGVPGYTTIHGYKGSTAETYAKTYGYTFVEYNG